MFKTEYNKNCKGHMSITNEEVMNMPRRDGTGPMGRGATNGRGLGVCNGANAVGYGAGSGIGYRRDLGRNLGRNSVAEPTVSKTQKELLQEKKELLESRFDIISKQLGSL